MPSTPEPLESEVADRPPLGLDSPLGTLLKLLPTQTICVVESSETVCNACRQLHERGLWSCIVRFPDQSLRFFDVADLCAAFLDALNSDSLAIRVLAVLGASAIGDLSRHDPLVLIDESITLRAAIDRLCSGNVARIPIKGPGGDLIRLFSCSDLLELLLRCGRSSCAALHEPVGELLGIKAGASVETAAAGESVLTCLQRLRSFRLRGMTVLDDTEGDQPLLERALGTVTGRDVKYLFLRQPGEAAHMVSLTLREFIALEMQELASPLAGTGHHAVHPHLGHSHHGAARYPFIHVAPEANVDVVASKLLASHAASSSITLCSLPLSEIYGTACARDLVKALQPRLQGVVFERHAPGTALSPRLWPSPSAQQQPLSPLLLPGSLPADGSREERRVSWLDEKFGVSLATVFEYAAEDRSQSHGQASASAAVLALEDAQEESLASAVKLPRASLTVLTPEMIQARVESPSPVANPEVEREKLPDGVLSSLALQHPLLKEGEAITTCESGQWRQLGQNAHAEITGSSSSRGPQPHGEHVGMWHGGHGEQLQLVLYQQRDLVLYDRRQNRMFARRLTDEQANALATNKNHFCPLCRQRLNPSWAFVVEGYFEMLSTMAPREPSEAGEVPVRDPNEEAAAAADLHNIPANLLNVGYYSRFFVEDRRLGAGSFGAVYLCRHVMDEIELGVFAVKKLALGDDLKRLRNVVREVKALERLRHVNIIDYKHSWLEVSRHSEFCPWVPFLFILMEYCNAGSLENLIWPNDFVRGAPDNAAKATMLSERLIWLLFTDICGGLRHLHSRSILHRDLKPSNILLHIEEVQEGSTQGPPVPIAKLSDFGTCEIIGDSAANSAVHGGYAVEFMAPERLRGEESDEPADMWSAGLVLYAMCYGDLPYHSDDPDTCREKVIGHSMLSDMSDFRNQSLRSLISALTARSPVARPTAEDAERVSSLAAQRCCEAESTAGSAPCTPVGQKISPQMLPSLPPPPPLELMDADMSPANDGHKQRPAKLLRIVSASSLSSEDAERLSPSPPAEPLESSPSAAGGPADVEM